MNELSQLDELIESDILEALGQETPNNNASNEIEISDDEINIEDFNDELTIENNDDEIKIENFDESIEDIKDNEEIPLIEKSTENIHVIDSTLKSNDLASLLSQLLNNKTIEITIKIKD